MAVLPNVEHTWACAFKQRGGSCDCAYNIKQTFDFSQVADFCTGPDDDDPLDIDRLESAMIEPV